MAWYNYIMKNKRVSKKILKYTAIFEPANEGGFVVSVPALPGCFTQGDSFEEATDMIKDAISGYLAVLKDTKQVIPEEKSDLVVTQVAVPYGFI